MTDMEYETKIKRVLKTWSYHKEKGFDISQLCGGLQYFTYEFLYRCVEQGTHNIWDAENKIYMMQAMNVAWKELKKYDRELY